MNRRGALITGSGALITGPFSKILRPAVGGSGSGWRYQRERGDVMEPAGRGPVFGRRLGWAALLHGG